MIPLPDTRYTVRAEGRGHANRVWVARFCRRWIGCYLNRADALAACLEYSEWLDYYRHECRFGAKPGSAGAPERGIPMREISSAEGLAKLMEDLRSAN